MGRFAPLVIHRNEWERLQNQANPKTEPETVPRKVDIEAMNAQSRQWTSSWPDSVQGHVNKVIMKKKKLHSEEIAAIDALHMKKKQDNTAETLRRARDMIFERTNYGKELLSALNESKTLDERAIQIKFKTEIQEKEKKIEEGKSKVENIMYAEFEKGESNRLFKKQKGRADAEYNKATAEMKREEALRAAKIEKNNREEDAKMIEKLRQLQILEEEAVQIYEEQNKVIREMRAKREILEQKLADLWQQHQDRIRRKEKEVFDQERENEEKLKKEQQRIIKTSQAPTMKSKSQVGKHHQKILCSDKQSFLPRKRGQFESKHLKGAASPPRAPFPARACTWQQALQQRQALAGGWSGARAAHAQFARRATAALAEASHKHAVRKVVDNYRKENNVKDLPVPNY